MVNGFWTGNGAKIILKFGPNYDVREGENLTTDIGFRQWKLSIERDQQ